MIDDIVFDVVEFILEIPSGVVGGDIVAYSLDGQNYDFINPIVSGGSESSYTFIS